MQQKSKLSILTNGLIRENPVLVLILGTCPALAVTTMAINGLGMGAATTIVLVCSNIVISLIKHIIPGKVRIPCYIVVIAGFVTVVQFLAKAYAPDIDDALGVFLPLIVVNCIILGRAELFASKHSVLDSALDGLGMGAGFTLALFVIGSAREIIGKGTWFADTGFAVDLMELPLLRSLQSLEPTAILAAAPGGFFVFGVTIALVNRFTKGKGVRRKTFGCEGCPSAAACGHRGEGGECEQ